MTIIDLVVMCLMALGVVVGVGEPLARRWLYSVQGHESGNAPERLLLQKEMLYGAIRDLVSLSRLSCKCIQGLANRELWHKRWRPRCLLASEARQA